LKNLISLEAAVKVQIENIVDFNFYYLSVYMISTQNTATL